jgi:hypothetical protein
MKHMASAAREVADALTGDTAPKPKNLAVARQEAEAAESSTRSGANAITAALGVPAGEVATIPVVGPIIAASLLAIAAVLIMIGVIAAKSLEKNAAEKEKGSGRRPARKKEDDD